MWKWVFTSLFFLAEKKSCKKNGLSIIRFAWTWCYKIGFNRGISIWFCLFFILCGVFHSPWLQQVWFPIRLFRNSISIKYQFIICWLSRKNRVVFLQNERFKCKQWPRVHSHHWKINLFDWNCCSIRKHLLFGILIAFSWIVRSPLSHIYFSDTEKRWGTFVCLLQFSLNKSTLNRFERLNALPLIFRIDESETVMLLFHAAFNLIGLNCIAFFFFSFGLVEIWRGILLINANSLKMNLNLGHFFKIRIHAPEQKWTEIKIQPLTMLCLYLYLENIRFNGELRIRSIASKLLHLFLFFL